MKRYSQSLLLGLVCALVLCACGRPDGPVQPTESGSASKPDTSISAPTLPPVQGEQSSQSAPDRSEPEQSRPEGFRSYTIPLDGATQIYNGPSYDWEFLRHVEQDGVYTIVEEAVDEESNLWGRLKSGVGWVDLTYIRSGWLAEAPITASYAHKALLDSGDYHRFVAQDAQRGVKILFRAREKLKNVTVTSLGLEGQVEQVLYTLDQLTEQKPLVVQVLFYGDLTAYGISFTDSSGTERSFSVCISGRNGALVLQDLNP